MTYGNTKSFDDISTCQLFANFFKSVYTNGNITNSNASLFMDYKNINVSNTYLIDFIW